MSSSPLTVPSTGSRGGTQADVPPGALFQRIRTFSGVPVEFTHSRRFSPLAPAPRDVTARNCTSLVDTSAVTSIGSSSETLGGSSRR